MRPIFFKYWWEITVILIAFLFFTFLMHHTKNKLKRELQLTKVELSTLKDSVKVVTSKNGELTFKLASVEVDKSNLKKALVIAGYTIKDLKEKEIAWRNITNTLKAQLVANASGSTVLHDTTYVNSTDTIKAAEFAWNNRFLFLNGKIVDKHMNFNYTYKTGIDIINTKKKNSYLINVYLSDPNAVITTANSLTITRTTKWYQKPWVWGVTGLVGGMLIIK